MSNNNLAALINDYNNHFIDPMFFAEAIEMFAFNYLIFRQTGVTKTKTFEEVHTYTRDVIHGSLQSLGKVIHRSKMGNTESYEYNFYCRSLYRIDEGDIIKYRDKFLLVDRLFDDYDEAGVRAVHLTMFSLNALKDFAEWAQYQTGEKIV